MVRKFPDPETNLFLGVVMGWVNCNSLAKNKPSDQEIDRKSSGFIYPPKTGAITVPQKFPKMLDLLGFWACTPGP